MKEENKGYEKEMEEIRKVTGIKEEPRSFKVNINADMEYYAKDKEDCLELVQEDFAICEDDIDIKEIKDEWKNKTFG